MLGTRWHSPELIPVSLGGSLVAAIQESGESFFSIFTSIEGI